MSDLFASAGLDRDAPRPLADRLRPTRLSEVVGQDHLVGPDGALTRLLAIGLARLPRVLGAARHRQDDGGAAARRCDEAAFRADLGDLLRRRRSEEAVRGGPRAPKHGAGDASVRRRGAPLQPRPARRLPAGDGGRHHHARRSDDREPVLRAQRGAPVARPRHDLQGPRRAGPGDAADARRGGARKTAAADDEARARPWSAWPTATGAPR